MRANDQHTHIHHYASCVLFAKRDIIIRSVYFCCCSPMMVGIDIMMIAVEVLVSLVGRQAPSLIAREMGFMGNNSSNGLSSLSNKRERSW